MSLGGNLSSGHTNTLIDDSINCSIVKQQQIAHTDKCCAGLQKQPVARYPSMVLLAKPCPPPSPADFAKYPKIAVPSSVRTQALANRVCNPDPLTRFQKYQRYQVPVPCPPLPASSNMAGKSLPSSRLCNL